MAVGKIVLEPPANAAYSELGLTACAPTQLHTNFTILGHTGANSAYTSRIQANDRLVWKILDFVLA